MNLLCISEIMLKNSWNKSSFAGNQWPKGNLEDQYTISDHNGHEGASYKSSTTDEHLASKIIGFNSVLFLFVYHASINNQWESVRSSSYNFWCLKFGSDSKCNSLNGVNSGVFKCSQVMWFLSWIRKNVGTYIKLDKYTPVFRILNIATYILRTICYS